MIKENTRYEIQAFTHMHTYMYIHTYVNIHKHTKINKEYLYLE